MSETMNYEALSRDVCRAALTELIPTDLRARGVHLIEYGTCGCDIYVVWIGGGGFYKWGAGHSYQDAVEHGCSKVVERLEGLR